MWQTAQTVDRVVVGQRPRAAQVVDLPTATRAWIDAFCRNLERMTLFEMLGVGEDADLLSLRRAYFKRSKLLHPDRYFSRRLGPYKRVLERCFEWIAAAYKFLKDDERRAAYRRTLQAQRGTGPASLVRPIARGEGLEFVVADPATRRPDPRTASGEIAIHQLMTKEPAVEQGLVFVAGD